MSGVSLSRPPTIKASSRKAKGAAMAEPDGTKVSVDQDDLHHIAATLVNVVASVCLSGEHDALVLHGDEDPGPGSPHRLGLWRGR